MNPKSSHLKQKLQNKEVSIGTWITIGHEIVAEVLCGLPFDWLVVDMEHSAIDIATAQRLVRVIEMSGKSPLVRVSANDATLIKRVMDTGAHGVIVPMVNTAEDARRAVAAVKYPPHGFRGVGLARAQGYGTGFEGYKNWLQQHSVVVVQIEHIDAVENFKEIMSVPGVDGFIIGPYDLSGSLGHPGEFEHPEVKKSLETVRRLSREMDVVAGFHVIPPDPAEVRRKIEEGYRMIAYSLDTLVLQNAYKESLQEILK